MGKRKPKKKPRRIKKGKPRKPVGRGKKQRIDKKKGASLYPVAPLFFS